MHLKPAKGVILKCSDHTMEVIIMAGNDYVNNLTMAIMSELTGILEDHIVYFKHIQVSK